MNNEIKKIMTNLPGKIGLYYQDLSTREAFGITEHEGFIAASVIKLPILIAVLNKIHKGELNKNDQVTMSALDKVPGCGALRHMHNDLVVTISDLCHLMIVLSDNTATNILIRLLGFDYINQIFTEIDFKTTKLNRLLFDYEKHLQGIENYFSPLEIGQLLEKIYKKTILTEELCDEVIDILKKQQINHKIPYLLPDHIEIAHKTGEDEGITHDVGLIFGKKPFILCFASNKTDVILAEAALRRIALICYEHSK